MDSNSPPCLVQNKARYPSQYSLYTDCNT